MGLQIICAQNTWCWIQKKMKNVGFSWIPQISFSQFYWYWASISKACSVTFFPTLLLLSVPSSEVRFSPIRQRVKTKLVEERALAEWTTLSINVIIEILRTYIRTTYFRVDNRFYQQEFGISMGSPLSPTLIYIFMEGFEKRPLDQNSSETKLWRGYTDVTFVIWQHKKKIIDKFLENQKNIEKLIEFTMKFEKPISLPRCSIP